jgi:hypothetical protein
VEGGREMNIIRGTVYFVLFILIVVVFPISINAGKSTLILPTFDSIIYIIGAAAYTLGVAAVLYAAILWKR